MHKLGSILEKYFLRADKYSTLRFILELTALAFAAKIPFVLLGSIIFHLLGVNTEVSDEFEKQLLSEGWIYSSLAIILFATFETLTGQWLIIWLSSLFTKRTWLIILCSASVFALLHLEPMLVVSVFPVGVILAWSFLLKRKISLWRAIWVTTAVHALHNLIVQLIVFLGTK